MTVNLIILSLYSVAGRFGYKSFRIEVDSPLTSKSFRLRGLSRFAYIEVDSPTLNAYY